MINNYKDLTLGKYLQLREIDPTCDEMDIQVQMLSILSDKDEEEILDLPLPEYRKLVGQTAFLVEQPVAGKTPPREITVNGRKYSVLRDAKEMTAGQYIDYQNYISDTSVAEKNLPFLLSCFVIPKGKKYGDYDLEEVVSDIRCMPIETVLTLSSFFFRQSQNSINNMLIYLDWMTKRMEKREKDETKKAMMKEAREKVAMLQDLLKDGDG